MDVLNFISWTKNGRTVSTVDPSKTLLPVGLKDLRRDDSYLAGSISVADFASSLSPSLYDANGNTFIGENVFNTISNPDKWSNTAIGKNALKNTVGQQNIGIGAETLYNNTTGFQNIAIGNQALNSNMIGENNVAIGIVSMLFNTTGINNMAIGSFALFSNTTGRDNIAIGVNALRGVTSGSYNVGIGPETDSGNYSSCVLLGRRATATGDNQFSVGSLSNPAGSVTSEVNTSTSVWNVRINGVARKILLA